MQFIALIDLKKTFYTVTRLKLWEILVASFKSQEVRTLAFQMFQIHSCYKIIKGSQSSNGEFGVVQGDV